MKTLKEMIAAGDRILFISPEPVRAISIGIGLYASPASVMLSFDGETFDDAEIIIKPGVELELAVAAKIVAVEMQDKTNCINSGMIAWSY